MSKPEITIITPVFNCEKYIANTIDSVLNYSKNYRIEYIVINDGSTDKTLDILMGYSRKIRIISTNNFGESSAINRGIEESNSEILLVVNADDPLLTSKIFEGVTEEFLSNSGIVAIYSNWQQIDREGKILKVVNPGPYSDAKLIGNFNCLPGPGTFFRKSSAQIIGGRNKKWKYVGDYDFWLKLSREGDFLHRNQVLAQWRSHPESSSVRTRDTNLAEERIGVIKDFISNYSIHPQLRRLSLSSAYYYAAQTSYFDSSVHSRRFLVASFFYARGWPPVAKIKFVTFVIFLPFSRLLLKLFARI
jgi:glycosyltransferase involved in cell wall biosynthesis